MTIVWSPVAMADLDSVYDYIALDSPGAAFRITEKIEESIERLRDFPEMGRPSRWPDTRELVIPGTHFIILYMIKRRRIIILAVIHAARRWPE